MLRISIIERRLLNHLVIVDINEAELGILCEDSDQVIQAVGHDSEVFECVACGDDSVIGDFERLNSWG